MASYNFIISLATSPTLLGVPSIFLHANNNLFDVDTTLFPSGSNVKLQTFLNMNDDQQRAVFEDVTIINSMIISDIIERLS